MNMTTLESLFTQYRDDALIAKLESYARFTIPSVFPDDVSAGANRNAEIEYDGQSIGADLVGRLATKLARTLFPAGISFFKIMMNDAVQKQLKASAVEDIQTLENEACSRLFLNASYAQLIQALRLLIITGEALIHRVDDRFRVFSLRNYSAKRSTIGDTLDLVILEEKHGSELTAKQRSIARCKETDKCKLYTRVKLETGTAGIKYWRVTQEINGKDIGTDEIYKYNLCPYVPVYWNFVNGDTYGRGYVEEYGGDFHKLSTLSAALAEYELQSLKMLHLVNPAGVFDVAHANEADTGEYIQGDPNTVAPYESGDFQKMMQIKADLDSIEQRLKIAFMYQGNTREGERVTAYEIGRNAEEAEQALGGVYSVLAQSLHLPLAYLLLNEVNPTIIEDFDRNNLKLDILTGVQALSRSAENQALVIASSEINAVVPAIVQLGLDKTYSVPRIVDSILVANGVNISKFKLTGEELQALAQAEQQQQAQLTMQAQQLGGQESAVGAIQQAQNL